MIRIFYPLMAIIALTLLSACSSDESNNTSSQSRQNITFSATHEDVNATSRASLSDDAQTIVWNSGDQLSVFDGTANNAFTLKSGDASSSAIFQGEAATSPNYVAVYPYQSAATLSGVDVQGVILPATQTATANGFDKTAALMMAATTTTELTFKNVVGYMKLTPKFDCTKIELKAFDNSAVLAGKGTLAYNDGEPTLDLSAAPVKDYAITLKGDIIAGNAYYIAVPAVTLKAGWTLKFTATDGKVYSRKGTKDITFKRNYITNVGEFATTDDKWYNPSGKLNQSQELDLGLTLTIGTKNYKVLFARGDLKANGIANGLSETGDFFAWAATEPLLTSYKCSNYKVTPTAWKKGVEGGYKQANTPYYDGTAYTKYKKGETLEMMDDAANQILGGDWQVPPVEVWRALYKARPSIYWGSENNGLIEEYYYTKVMLVCNAKEEYKSDNGVFLRPLGYISGKSQLGSTSVTDLVFLYLSNTAHSNTNAYCLRVKDKNDIIPDQAAGREYGLLIRPIRLVAL